MLYPFAWLYGSVSFLRNLCYHWGWFKNYRLSAPVISIGNLSIGGTGKTPVAIALAQLTAGAPYGKKPALLSRGYRRQSRGFILVSDGQNPPCSWEQSGDEPQTLALALPGIPVAVDEDRVRGGQRLVDQLAAEVLILDDGFQHRRLFRDLDIVLLDAERDLSEPLLPVGRLREPLGSLARAHLIILTHHQPDQMRSRALWETCVRLFGETRLLTCRYRATGCRDLRTHEVVPLEHLRGKRLLPFCGIAHPEGFARSLTELGAEISHVVRFLDHHHYHVKDVERLAQAYTQSHADYLITTEKDAVKLEGLFRALPILVLRIEVEWLAGQENLRRELNRLFKI